MQHDLSEEEPVSLMTRIMQRVLFTFSKDTSETQSIHMPKMYSFSEVGLCMLLLTNFHSTPFLVLLHDLMFLLSFTGLKNNLL